MNPNDEFELPSEPEVIQGVSGHFIKSNYFRVIHADGAWGGTTPQLNIQMVLYNERQPIPTRIDYDLSEMGQVKEVGRESRRGIVREVEVSIVMSPELARSLRTWLTDKLRDIDRLKRQARTVGEARRKNGKS